MGHRVRPARLPVTIRSSLARPIPTNLAPSRPPVLALCVGPCCVERGPGRGFAPRLAPVVKGAPTPVSRARWLPWRGGAGLACPPASLLMSRCLSRRPSRLSFDYVACRTRIALCGRVFSRGPSGAPVALRAWSWRFLVLLLWHGSLRRLRHVPGVGWTVCLRLYGERST
jgi:hypothetical protein